MIKTPVYLTDGDAEIFKKFIKHQDIIAYLIGYLDSTNIKDMTNSQVVLDIDSNGNIGHMAITKHFRK